jgi:ABC-2 type transport system permease protein
MSGLGTITTQAPRSHLHRSWRAYRAYLRTSVLISFQYRVFLFASIGVTVIWVLMLSRIWTAVYRGRPSLAGFDLHTTIVYITLANLQTLVLGSVLAYVMSNRIRGGQVVFDLGRPIGYLGQMLALHGGNSLLSLGFALVAAPFAALAGGLDAPASVTAGACYLLALILGWTLNAAIALLIGLTAFWTVNNEGFSTLMRFVAAFFAGTTVPLAFLPGPLRVIADLLPFRFVIYQPAAIYVGQIRGTEMLTSLVGAVVWIGLLGLLVRLVWSRAHRRVAIHGG